MAFAGERSGRPAAPSAATLAVMLALLAAAPLSAAAQSMQVETLLTSYPTGGQDLTAAVGEAISNNPEQASAFCSAAGTAPLSVQSAIGTGLAYGVQLLQASNSVASADVIHSMACGASGCQGAARASYALSMGTGAGDLCRFALSDQAPASGEEGEEAETLKTPPPTLFSTSATPQGSNALAVASPN